MLTLDIRRGAAPSLATAPLPEVTLEAWRAGARPNAPAALIVPNTVDIASVSEELADFGAVILEFPSFRDGRAYSQARLLRERYGYTGEIRARGEILRDQALFMARAGFDAIEIEDRRAAGVAEALGEFSAFYQQGADGSQAVWRRRNPSSKAA
jgi:uncharacterized protein (DUF934 family)